MNRRLPPGVVAEAAAARVKWYNATKGFGFLSLDEDGRDVFLHASVLQQSEAGPDGLPEGATVICDVAETQKGLQVALIHSIDMSTAIAPSPGGFGAPRGGPGGRRRPPSAPTEGPFDGVVKFFNTAKGYGFITVDGQDRDVFISGRVLERSGLMTLEPNQTVRVSTQAGDKGPVAVTIEII